MSERLEQHLVVFAAEGLDGLPCFSDQAVGRFASLDPGGLHEGLGLGELALGGGHALRGLAGHHLLPDERFHARGGGNEGLLGLALLGIDAGAPVLGFGEGLLEGLELLRGVHARRLRPWSVAVPGGLWASVAADHHVGLGRVAQVVHDGGAVQFERGRDRRVRQPAPPELGRGFAPLPGQRLFAERARGHHRLEDGDPLADFLEPVQFGGQLGADLVPEEADESFAAVVVRHTGIVRSGRVRCTLAARRRSRRAPRSGAIPLEARASGMGRGGFEPPTDGL